ncbi:A kinase (PRKA) anchor protein 1b [Chanos chanos]|uniref:A-kinase anchor protein 1, mitochondrial n=1 Tax=Chanos chanos TaxID=29144 RepID=A0A6J2VM03_CHACN|nr:A-kinase anchor protein 1, mitochondrial [Chanos chanos]XP_030632994.1 A-kinase anchor protein 1, mitochondrial [Chanos chanos]
MPLRFRSFVPYTLPGVLALIGWWWYISRKKGRITSHDSQEGGSVSLLASPSEGSNGMVDKGCPSAGGTHRRTSRDKAKAKEQKLVEQQEVVAQVHVPASKAVSEEQPSLATTLQRELDSLPHIDKATIEPQQSLPETVRQKQPVLTAHLSETVGGKPQQKGPEGSVVGDLEQSLAGREPTITALDTQSLEKTVNREEPTTKESTPVPVAVSGVVSAVTTSAELAKAERPEPEGEVAAEEITLSFAENLQADLAKDGLSSTKQELPPTAAERDLSATPLASKQEPFCPETPSALASPSHFSTSTPATEASTAEDLGTQQLQENGVPAQPMEGGESIEELQRLAAGLITEVISAATQEVMTIDSREAESGSFRTTEPGSSGTPSFNGRLSGVHEEVARGRTQPVTERTSSSVTHTDREEVVNGCLATSAWDPLKDTSSKSKESERRGHSVRSAQGVLEASPVLAKLQAEDAAAVAEDSGCSTCQSEDGTSTEDLLHSSGLSSALPESKEDLMQISGMSRDSEGKEESFRRSPGVGALKEITSPLTTEHVAAAASAAAAADETRLNGTGLRNGAHTTNETDADQSGGSDVNSMDSVDSGCTLGTGEGQQSGSQSQNSELIVWEIEVPKHLVGRLIGKQGRYVSFLKQSSGAKIYISTLPYTQEFQICHIEGTQQQVDKALALIGKKFKDLDLTNLYAPPPLPLTLPSLPMTSWLLLPSGVTVEVIVVNIVSAGHVFVQQHTHPTYHALRSLDQQMFLCYSQPGTPALPTPVEVGVICAAPAVDGAWWRAQVISFYKDSNEVEIRYVDYGGYDRVKIDTLRQIRSDFVTLPFQGTEVLLDNIAPLPGEDRFSAEANSALEEMTRGVALLAQVTNYDNNTGLPLVQLWNMVGDELVLLNRTLAERGFGTWVDSF